MATENKNLECKMVKEGAGFLAGEDVVLTTGEDGLEICGGGGSKTATVPYGEIRVLCLSETPEFRKDEAFSAVPDVLGSSMVEELGAAAAEVIASDAAGEFNPDVQHYLFLIGCASDGETKWISMQDTNNLKGIEFMNALEKLTGAKVFHNVKKLEKEEKKGEV